MWHPPPNLIPITDLIPLPSSPLRAGDARPHASASFPHALVTSSTSDQDFLTSRDLVLGRRRLMRGGKLRILSVDDDPVNQVSLLISSSLF